MRRSIRRLLAWTVALALLVGVLPAVGAVDADDLEQIDLENGNFENGTEFWTLAGLPGEVIDNSSSAENASAVLNLWASNDEAVEIFAGYTLTLTPGFYQFSFEMDGMDADSQLYYTVSSGGEILCNAGPIVTTGWDQWAWYETEIFELTERASVTFALHGTAPQGYWGHLDNLSLYGTGEVYVELPEIELPNGDFEDGDGSHWSLGSDYDDSSVQLNGGSAVNGSYVLNLWKSDSSDYSSLVSYRVRLRPGSYKFSFDIEGKDGGGYVQAVLDSDGINYYESNYLYTEGWDSWKTYETGIIRLEENTTLDFMLMIEMDAGYWAKLDNLRLYGTGGIVGQGTQTRNIALPNSDFENGTEYWKLYGLSGDVLDNSASAQNASQVLNLWVSDDEPAQIAANYSVLLTEGYYRFDFMMDGAAMDSNLRYTVSDGNSELLDGGPVVTTGWDDWQAFSTGQFHVEETSLVTFSLHGVTPAGYWGHLDNLALYGTGDIEMPEILLPNSDFEYGDGSYWKLDVFGNSQVIQDSGDSVNNSYVLDLRASSSFVVRYPVNLTSGSYRLAFDIEGSAGGEISHLVAFSASDMCVYESDPIPTRGTDEWFTFMTPEFTVDASGILRIEIDGGLSYGEWYHIDNLRLFGDGHLSDALPPMNTDDGNFDYGGSNWSIQGFSDPGWNSGSEVNSSYCLPLWISDEEDTQASASYLMHLLPGSYELSYDLEGKEGLSGLHALVSTLGAESSDESAPLRSGDTLLYDSGELETHGYDLWETHRTDTFTLAQPGWVKFELSGTVPAGYWGHFDNLQLFGDGDYYPEHFPHDPTLVVPKVPGVEDYEFVRGADISSYLSLVNAGAQFYDYEGNPLDDMEFFQLLFHAGFNYVRIRVWVDPFDAQGRGYGGGNNDLDTAKYLARLATDVGLRVLIDFHYSDFWADPGKQQAPKAWAGYNLSEKVAAVEEYTYNSLKTIKQWCSDGYLVDMVQIGNETTSGVCGETGWSNMAQIFAAGARAVRRLDEERMEETKVTIHFTNPERSSTIKGFADRLNQYGVDYDVFATSWYPYWHGTTDNLTNVLKYVADTYDKEVLVAETSWAWTLDDGDGHDNTVRVGSNDSGNAYPFSQQGQADELVAATQAVTAVGEKGLGVFYWENAWIPVQYAYDANGNLDPAILASNQAAWEQYGCGWASSYAGEYQTDAAQWHGGSAVDNQAMFDFNGQALDSLWSWYYMMYGTEALFGKEVESVEGVELELNIGDSVTLPETVQVTYNLDGTIAEPVEWNADDLAAVDVNTPGVYTVRGTVTLSFGLGTAETTATVTVNHPNLLLNFDFESSDLSMYAFTGNHDWSTDTPHGGNRCLHFYNSNASVLDFSQTVTLQPGEYSFSLFAQGDAKGGTEQYIYVSLAEETLTESFALAGWAVWQNPELRFTVTQETAVTVGAHIAYGAGGWGTFDDLCLRLTAQPEPTPAEPIETSDLRVFSSISVGTDMVVTWSARKSDVQSYEKFWIEVVKHAPEGDESYRYGAEEDEGLTENTSTWQADFTHVFAKEMGLEIEARLCAQDAGGQIYRSPAKTVCIRDYLAGRLTATNNRVEQRVLCADILNYGAAAQKYLNYETDHLVNQELTTEQLAKLRQYQTKTLPAVEKTNGNYRPEGQSNILFNSVSLDNEVILTLNVRANENDEVKILRKDHESGTVLEILDAAWNGSSFTVEYKGIGAEQMRVAYDFVAQINGVETGNVRTWSVEGYVGEIRNENLPLKTAMANALLTYGDSAAAYFAAQ